MPLQILYEFEMSQEVSVPIRDKIRRKYEEADLETAFAGNGDISENRTRKQLRGALDSLVDSPELRDGLSIASEYQAEADEAFENLLRDYLGYGILKEPQDDVYCLALTGAINKKSTSDDPRVKKQLTEPYTVYRRRMDTSGVIDVKPNGKRVETDQFLK